MLMGMTHEKIHHNEREAASRLGLPVSWLRREADAGRVPCLRVGRRRMFNVEAVKAALADRAKREAVARG